MQRKAQEDPEGSSGSGVNPKVEENESGSDDEDVDDRENSRLHPSVSPNLPPNDDDEEDVMCSDGEEINVVDPDTDNSNVTTAAMQRIS